MKNGTTLFSSGTPHQRFVLRTLRDVPRAFISQKDKVTYLRVPSEVVKPARLQFDTFQAIKKMLKHVGDGLYGKEWVLNETTHRNFKIKKSGAQLPVMHRTIKKT